MKRAVLFFFSLFFIPSTQAQWSGNWLIGASGGFVRHNGQYTLAMDYSRIPAFPITYVIDDYRDYGPVWGVLGGYQLSFDRWVVGAELNLDWYDTNHDLFFPYADRANAIIWNGKERYDHHVSPGISARVGYAMAPYFLAYMRAGIETSKDKLNGDFSSTNFIFDSIHIEGTKWMPRYFAGVGAETPLPWINRLALRLEYNVHIPYRHNGANGIVEDGILDPSFMLESKPKTQAIKGSLIWNIA